MLIPKLRNQFVIETYNKEEHNGYQNWSHSITYHAKTVSE